MPACRLRHADGSDRGRWDGYVRGHPAASLYHLFGWGGVFRRVYGHATHYLMALDKADDRVIGVLPLVHFKHAIFGNRLVSMPFVDGGGILASSSEAEYLLLAEAVRVGRELGAGSLELRNERGLESAPDVGAAGGDGIGESLRAAVRTDKVRMLLTLPESSRLLMDGFKSKLRSQVNRPLKEGLAARVGGAELLEDFYAVFLVNMRELGSPVHSVDLMRHVLAEFPGQSAIIVVYRSKEPVASALVAGHGKMLRNPWASSLRKYAFLSPNMLLYLRMLEYACDNGYRVFDFGRSTAGEGTYRFKEQWGAVPAPLYWNYVSLDGKSLDPGQSGVERFRGAARFWKMLPLAVTKVIGPHVRKHISL